MFHQGNLQSGISLAIQEQKLVGILVRDDGAESATWENEWLRSGWIANLLEQTAVLLRLEAGSTEAGFLSAFCTISSTPTFVVIQNGQLKEQLSVGVTQDEFVNRVRQVLGGSPIPGSTRSSTTNRPATTEAQESPANSPLPNVAAPQAAAPAPAPAPVSAQSPTPPPSSKEKGKQKAVPSQPPTQSSAAQQAARDALRKKKREEKEELERIKARIEADKAERKAQAEARKVERERERQQQQQSSADQQSTPQFTSPSTKGSQAAQVHLNVRLFDGRTVRSTFPRTAKLETDVRPWVDREAAAAASTSETPRPKQPPYYFKQILAPLPSRELSVSDEAETLGDIDLAPSATLVLVPVQGYTEAYSGGGSGGIVYGAAGNVMGLVGGVFNAAGSVLGYVGNTVSSIMGGGGDSTTATDPLRARGQGGQSLGSAPSQADSGGTSASGGSTANANVRVRTLADQRTRDPQPNNLYNGNQLSYTPRNGYDEE